ncbi:MAG: DMT family transporter [Rhodospirillales bacterium]|jgi:drug/metabolite transporter (DMT)-like permease|nr:DMT family transporter [Rhodospirillales bacterium]MBT4005469.1 DMT family transporter [Rhodospirillales bacterium]MBT5076456.1 DMT family transporter [Rhodospirillales bacterium]MBT5112520.1 DMT family transporter [Rhodospirillales bacterium]MBT5673279.1 DMT family transporter [Rhodospirillales bacterium]
MSAPEPPLQAFKTRWNALSANLRGAVWIMVAALLLTAMGGLVKQIGTGLETVQVVFFRSLIGAVLLLPFMLRSGLKGFKTKRPFMHSARTIVGVTGMFCVFYAFAHLPLAETVAIVFSRPLFAVALAVPFLGEVVGWRRVTAAIVGFIGVLIMVRPGTAAFDPASLYAVTAAFTAGTIAILIKKLSATEAGTAIVMWFSVGSAVITFVPTLMVWIWPTPLQWGLLALIGVIGVIGQTAMTWGFSTGETSFVAPFDYSRLIFAAIIGLFVFSEIPDTWAIIGAMIIVSSGYYIARREIALSRARKRADQ